MEVESNKKDVFKALSKINVSGVVREKNGFKYISWADALNLLLNEFPDTIWSVREWDGVPYLKTGSGCFVEVSVIIQGIERKQLHPILDFRNQPIMEPNAFQVNSSLQRCLAKAISLHGLGLYIYQGEDLPQSEKEAIDSMRIELIELLKKNNVDEKSIGAVYKLNVKQLMQKIEEYKSKDTSGN